MREITQDIIEERLLLEATKVYTLQMQELASVMQDMRLEIAAMPIVKLEKGYDDVVAKSQDLVKSITFDEPVTLADYEREIKLNLKKIKDVQRMHAEIILACDHSAMIEAAKSKLACLQI